MGRLPMLWPSISSRNTTRVTATAFERGIPCQIPLPGTCTELFYWEHARSDLMPTHPRETKTTQIIHTNIHAGLQALLFSKVLPKTRARREAPLFAVKTYSCRYVRSGVNTRIYWYTVVLPVDRCKFGGCVTTKCDGFLFGPLQFSGECDTQMYFTLCSLFSSCM